MGCRESKIPETVEADVGSRLSCLWTTCVRDKIMSMSCTRLVFILRSVVLTLTITYQHNRATILKYRPCDTTWKDREYLHIIAVCVEHMSCVRSSNHISNGPIFWGDEWGTEREDCVRRDAFVILGASRSAVNREVRITHGGGGEKDDGQHYEENDERNLVWHILWIMGRMSCKKEVVYIVKFPFKFVLCEVRM